MSKFRLLPFTVGALSALLLLKFFSLAEDGEKLSQRFLIGPVQAEDKEPEETAKTEKETEKKEKGEAPAEEEGHGGSHDEKPAEPPPVTHDPSQPSNELGGIRPEDRRFSPTELQLLQQLSERRVKLDEWEKNVQIKESLLATTEKRIDEKLVEMDGLKKELSAMIVQYNEQEDAKIKSLVRIYENMKARDAARIFDEIEMPILLMVIDKMSEKKAAPILASMDPKKAKQLTVELAEMRRLQSEKLSGRSAALVAPPPTTAPR